MLKRRDVITHRLQEALKAKLQEAGYCVVEDWSIFDDASNYPALNGSEVFTIDAMPSVKNHDNAAVVVDIMLVQGPHFEQKISLGVVPVMIEKGTDYDLQSKLVMEHSAGVMTALNVKPSIP